MAVVRLIVPTAELARMARLLANPNAASTGQRQTSKTP
jgi:hypothetical protein